MKRTRTFGAAALLLFLCLPAMTFGTTRGDPWAAWQSPSFTRLGDAVGLPHITATAVVRASDGTMWIGTRGGLTRYDGQRARSFKARRTDPYSLPDNYVRSLMALPDGGLLVGTNVAGLARYEPETGRFVRLKSKNGPIGSRIFGFTSDGAGGAYIASDGGIHHYLADTDRVDSMAGAGIKDPDGRTDGAFAVYRDADGTLWAGCEGGLGTPGGRHALPADHVGRPRGWPRHLVDHARSARAALGRNRLERHLYVDRSRPGSPLHSVTRPSWRGAADRPSDHPSDDRG